MSRVDNKGKVYSSPSEISKDLTKLCNKIRARRAKRPMSAPNKLTVWNQRLALTSLSESEQKEYQEWKSKFTRPSRTTDGSR